ncbi:MAG: hypothetical protein ACOC5T_06940, partial [Elusimicrobiota bacterium]
MYIKVTYGSSFFPFLVFKDSAYVINNQNLNGRVNRQYVSIGNRTDFIGGLGTCIDYEHTRYLKDKKGNLLDSKT